MNHILLAKTAVIRATWLYPEDTLLPNDPCPGRHKLQRIAGTLSLLVEAIKPFIATEPPEPAGEQNEVAR